MNLTKFSREQWKIETELGIINIRTKRTDETEQRKAEYIGITPDDRFAGDKICRVQIFDDEKGQWINYNKGIRILQTDEIFQGH